jgi:hypothetical protein
VSSRFYLSIGLTVAAVAVGGWRMLLPGTGGADTQLTQGVSQLLDSVTSAQFTGAEATLDAQHNATGSYAGAPVTAPLTLVRADATSYCIQLVQGPLARHVAGPGGTATVGPC